MGMRKNNFGETTPWQPIARGDAALRLKQQFHCLFGKWDQHVVLEFAELKAAFVVYVTELCPGANAIQMVDYQCAYCNRFN
jgi:hypothetical protein